MKKIVVNYLVLGSEQLSFRVTLYCKTGVTHCFQKSNTTLSTVHMAQNASVSLEWNIFSTSTSLRSFGSH
jgi:hypothetical protein